MSLAGIRKQRIRQQADRNGGVQLRVVVPFRKLIRINFTRIIHHPLKQAWMNCDLHFDVENPASRIFGLHIQNNDLGIFKFLVGKRILNRDLRDRSRQLKNRVQQTDQGGGILRTAEHLLEHKVHIHLDSQRHHLQTPRKFTAMYLRGQSVPKLAPACDA